MNVTLLLCLCLAVSRNKLLSNRLSNIKIVSNHQLECVLRTSKERKRNFECSVCDSRGGECEYGCLLGRSAITQNTTTLTRPKRTTQPTVLDASSAETSLTLKTSFPFYFVKYPNSSSVRDTMHI